MDKKTFTFLITSNRKGGTQSFTLSAANLKTWVAIGCIALVVIDSAAVDYFGLLLEQGENKRLKAENALLKKQFQVVESKVNSLETSLERVKSFETKLRLITNVEDENRSTKLAIGPMPKPGQAVDEYNEAFDEKAQREPSSEFFIKADEEALFLQEPPLAKEEGELTRETRNDYASLSIRIDRAVKATELREQGILSLLGTLSERQSLLLATPSMKPVRGWFTSRFGYRLDPFSGKPIMHAGLDIAAPPGTPVYAPADGVVSFVGYEVGYGRLVTIDHGYGVKTRYGHNSQVFVELGQKIKRWDVITAVGSTGRSSGPHLHYEVRVHDVPVDPINYILNE
jgi:murein DD-endopeptidase MepM/ murein hydrolase activator NlpD